MRLDTIARIIENSGRLTEQDGDGFKLLWTTKHAYAKSTCAATTSRNAQSAHSKNCQQTLTYKNAFDCKWGITPATKRRL